ncbi:MAG: homocitrate synthase family protein [Methanomassiliicoccales archaeon]|jgi:isopropylmalate/homocitrate/citramalate synthase|nr:homocitrate synthase family protein [Methanomassiliicoccales archaeon]
MPSQTEFIALSPYNVKQRFNNIIVYDSTLRDGEQMPGVAFNAEQKITIARLLDDARVPQIEAGFPAVSESEQQIIKEITSLGLRAKILALSRVLKSDIDAAVDAGVDLVLLFIATSDLHLKYKLKMNKEQVLSRVVDALDYCRERGVPASVSSEDSMRTDLDFLIKFMKTAEEAGASRLGITDTVGCASPEAVSFVVSSVASNVKKPISIHLHNDFGLALANAIAAVKAGASAVTTTVNGIGERSGNVPLEQFVSVMKFIYGCDLGIDCTRLKELSDTVARFSKCQLSPHHPLVGENAFAHESGIHVAAILNCPMTYECIPPEAVGNRRRLLMGKHTGMTFVKKRLEEMNINATNEQIQRILQLVKMIGEQKGRVTDAEFAQLVEKVLNEVKM